MFPHSTYGVSLSHCWNAGGFERASSQFRLGTVTERFDDNKVGICHDYQLYACASFVEKRHSRQIRFEELSQSSGSIFTIDAPWSLPTHSVLGLVELSA